MNKAGPIPKDFKELQEFHKAMVQLSRPGQPASRQEIVLHLCRSESNLN
jgi:hypothetical protein